ncbi:complex I subunit 5 family protein [Thermococcus sp. CX2]|uniref:complex I subunit 5 family protein n=1 Tax=Thermococcus sp. CX2 TaxID=163006 RepID=UPI001438D148|nr:proton-conducting transporter membrane subunit [Thermococcus sp. CX2]
MGIEALEIALAFFTTGAIMGVVGSYRASVRLSSLFAALGSTALIGYVFQVYTSKERFPIEGHLLGVPLYVDGFSLVFLIILGLSGLATSVYSVDYMNLYKGLDKARLYALVYNTFLASMALLIVTGNLMWFVFFWELMTLCSFVLIIWDEDKSLKPATDYYIAMQVLATVPLFISMGIGYSLTGSLETMSYTNIAGNIENLSTPLLALFYGSFLFAFMAKSGIVPFHFWVPEVYRTAPSNVSSLLAGIMEKVALYGLLRMTYTMLPPNVKFGYLVAILGIITLAVGSLYAFKETNAKRLLAYSSVGQMGYIWLGVGIGMALIPRGGELAIVGALGMVAGLFHALNHALFKGSLFLTVGTFEYSLGTQDLNRLGGLYRVMPFTALFALLSSFAISGIPPFNGFLSKWMLYEAGYYSGVSLFVLGSILAMFMSAVTLAYSFKFYTAAFCGKSELDGEEVPASMLFGQGILSILCLIIGIFPALVVPLLTEPVMEIVSSDATGIGYLSTYFSPVGFLIILGIIGIGLYIALPSKTEDAEPWDAGSTELPKDRFGMRARDYYLQCEERIGAFYGFGSAAKRVGEAILGAVVRGYLWIAKYFVKVSEIPGVDVKTLDDLRECPAVYLDEAWLMPVVRYIRTLWTVLRGV